MSKGQANKASFTSKKRISTASKPLDLLHMDFFEPTRLGEKRYNQPL